jgi:hypothetical protein
MAHRTMTDRDALKRIRPKGRNQRRQLTSILGYALIGVLGAGTLGYLVRKSRDYREQNWASADATIEDSRPQLIGQVNGQAGGEMLYEVKVLAAFPMNGKLQERWITVDQQPKSWDYATFEGRIWKSKHSVVRWKPSNPNQIVIDLH